MSSVKEHLAENYRFCMVRMCSTCGGKGHIEVAYSAANPRNWSGQTTGSNPVHHTECPDCQRGFQFNFLEAPDLIKWVIEGLKEDARENPDSFLKMVLNATEAVMTRGT